MTLTLISRNNFMLKAVFCILLICVFQHCAPSRYVKPLAKKQSALSFSFGGPLITYAPAITPIPFTTLGYAYGLTEKTTLFGSIHSTSALFGNAQADIGSTILLYEKENRYGFSASPALQIAYNLRNQTGFKIWPSLDLNSFLHLKNKPSYFYFGLSTWFEFSKYKAHQEVQPRHVFPNLQLGYTQVKTKWQHQFEVKYLGPGIPNTPGIVEYVGIAGQGSFGIFYSLIRKF